MGSRTSINVTGFGLLLAHFLGCSPVTSSDRNALEALPRLFEAPEFQLVSSRGQSISKESLEDKIWVVNFIFTRCGGPCPLMTQRLASVQKELVEKVQGNLESKVRLVSISVDPAYDTPEILQEYAELWGADTTSWHFLTGPPEETLRLIQDGFKIAATREGSGRAPDIIHSTNFLLVDQNGWIREIYHLDDPDLETHIFQGIQRLVKESEL